jgi:hypothetical protein
MARLGVPRRDSEDRPGAGGGWEGFQPPVQHSTASLQLQHGRDRTAETSAAVLTSLQRRPSARRHPCPQPCAVRTAHSTASLRLQHVRLGCRPHPPHPTPSPSPSPPSPDSEDGRRRSGGRNAATAGPRRRARASRADSAWPCVSGYGFGVPGGSVGEGPARFNEAQGERFVELEPVGRGVARRPVLAETPPSPGGPPRGPAPGTQLSESSESS